MSWLDRHRARFKRAVGMIGLTLAGWLAGTPVSLHAAPSAGVGISVRILNPPDAVTDLAASAVGSQSGDAQLTWTAPSNENGAAIERYLVRFATYPAAAAGPPADAWWSGLAATEILIQPAHAPGVAEFTAISGLSIGTTYYFGLKAVDIDGQISSVDARAGTAQQAKTLPLYVPGPPGTPLGLNGVAQSTSTILWQWLAAVDASFFTLNAHPSGVLIGQTTGLFLLETGLTANAPVSRTLRAANGFGLSPASAADTVYTLAATPSTPTLSGMSAAHVTLAWTSGGNPAGTRYRVERSEDGAGFAPIGGLITATTFTDNTVTQGTTYYYRVAGVNGDTVASPPGGALVVSPNQADFIKPREPVGLKGTIDQSRTAFTLIWDPVTMNEDGSPADDVAGYHVYRRAIISDPPVQLTTVPVSIPAFADVVNGAVYYYSARAVDNSGNLSPESLLADSSPEVNVIFVGPDGRSSVVMSGDASDLLRAGFNKYGVGLTIALEELPVPAGTAIVRSIRLRLMRGDNGVPVDDLVFPVPDVRIAIGYSVVNGEVVGGAPLAAGSTAAGAMAGVTPDQLSLFWNNGVSFVKVGGTHDAAARTIGLRTAFLGEYQLRISAAATSLSLDRGNVYPRLITPNGDGLNDRVFFILENPNDAAVRGEILDPDGRSVATLPDPSATSGIGTTLVWDGRDDHGNVVPGGVYIYKIEGEGNSFTGTVGVAR